MPIIFIPLEENSKEAWFKLIAETADQELDNKNHCIGMNFENLAIWVHKSGL